MFQTLIGQIAKILLVELLSFLFTGQKCFRDGLYVLTCLICWVFKQSHNDTPHFGHHIFCNLIEIIITPE